MGQITRLTMIANYAIDDPKRANQEQWEIPKTGICLNFGLIARPDISWPGDKQMADHATQQIRKAAEVGILGPSDLICLASNVWDSTFVVCLVEIDDLAFAQELFNKVTTDPDRIVDVYLYQDGRLIDKLD